MSFHSPTKADQSVTLLFYLPSSARFVARKINKAPASQRVDPAAQARLQRPRVSARSVSVVIRQQDRVSMGVYIWRYDGNELQRPVVSWCFGAGCTGPHIH